MKKIPLRTCCVTKKQFPKKELVRIVKNKDNEVFIDLTGRANGRGAYLNLSLSVIEKAKKTNCLGIKLETTIPDSIYDELKELLNE